ncbi:MAG: translation initiation factor IF-2 [Bacteroidetes bacterium]|nr:translation initiation factor IF-2 [Bacteroidota bacterium]
MADLPQLLRLSKVAKEFNIGSQHIVDFLSKKGHQIELKPNTKLTPEMYELLLREFQSEKSVKEESRRLDLMYSKQEEIEKTIEKEQKAIEKEQKESVEQLPKKETKTIEAEKKEIFKTETSDIKINELKIIGKLEQKKPAQKIKISAKKALKTEEEEKQIIELPEKINKTEIAESKKRTKEEKDTSKDVVKIDETPEVPVVKEEVVFDSKIKIIGKIDLDSMNVKTKPAKKTKEEKEEERNIKFPKKKKKEKKNISGIIKEEIKEVKPEEDTEEKPKTKIPLILKKEGANEEKSLPENYRPTEVIKLGAPTILGKMELPTAKELHKKPIATSSDDLNAKKLKRKRIKKDIKVNSGTEPPRDKPKFIVGKHKKEYIKPVASEEEIQKQIKETLARLSGTGKSNASKYRKLKREVASQQVQNEIEKMEEGKKVIKVTEFVTANELATMMNVQVTQIIATCMNLGLFVSINQRMDAETLSIIADEFGYKVEFVSVDVQEAIKEEIDEPENLITRHPIVTVMGHVDHGKTSLLDYIRKSNVIAGEAGSITQHIGAYEVTLENGKKITFLDTPGHEAFTAMRARGAQVTDLVIIVVAADDSVMPQTIEAINHASAAAVPIVFAINKIDKPNANSEKIKEQLANLNYLVEDWGGKFQSQEISAKKGINVDVLLEKILLESELLELKANPKKNATGTVIESSLDKGKGYVSTVLVQNGTLKIGDMVLAGCTYGRVKAMFNERNVPVKEAGPSTPVLLLGLNGAPQAGDKFNVMSDEHEVKNIATKRLQLQREQGLRTQKHITLDEIGRRIAIGDFKELNIIIKGDVDGSIEALTDALLKQSTAQVQVNVIHKSVGQITESDVLLASASNAIIIGFQVRPSVNARKLAEQEQIDIRLYSIIYNAINELKSAIEGMLSPEIEEKIVSNIEIREVYNITKVGTVAGCMVLNGKITRNTRIRIIRDGIVVHTGELGSLKRFKDDAKEVAAGYECGLNIVNFNDIKTGDIIEGFEEVEVKRKV